MESEDVPQPRMPVPDLSVWGKHDQGPAQFSASGSGGGSASVTPVGQRWANGPPAAPTLFSAKGRLKLNSTTSSAFTLVLPVRGPLVASAFTANPRNGKGLQPGAYAAGSYPGGTQFNDTAAPGGIQYSRNPFSVQDKEAATWTQNILARIERNWIIPAMARMGQSSQVVLILTVDHSGRELSLTVEKPSFQEGLDQAALNAMKASLPFPPLPGNISAGSFVFHFVFTYNA